MWASPLVLLSTKKAEIGLEKKQLEFKGCNRQG